MHKQTGARCFIQKIGIEPEVEVINIEGMAEEVEGVQEILLN